MYGNKSYIIYDDDHGNNGEGDGSKADAFHTKSKDVWQQIALILM